MTLRLVGTRCFALQVTQSEAFNFMSPKPSQDRCESPCWPCADCTQVRLSSTCLSSMTTRGPRIPSSLHRSSPPSLLLLLTAYTAWFSL